MRGLGLLLVAACGAKAPAAVENAAEPPADTARDRPRWTKLVHATRPQIDLSVVLPDFHDELRWPLTGMNHPTLEPRFPVAQELAIGVDWQQLCARGVQNRTSATEKELLGYLRGWCEAQRRDVDAACANLSPLLGSVRAGLRPAVRQDLANILVEHGDADKAEHWLSKHNIRDVATLDLLAANYVEVGSLADAFTINRRVMDADSTATPATTCMRLVKRIVIGLDHDPLAQVQQLKNIVLQAKVPDPTCERLWNKIACWRDHTWCAKYHDDENVPAEARRLLEAYDEWPPYKLGYFEWWAYADKARLALPTPGAAELVVTALETALLARTECPDGMSAGFRHTIEMVRRDPRAGEFEARLQAIEHSCRPPAMPPPPGDHSAGSAAVPSVTATPPTPASRPPAPKPVATWPPAPQRD